MERNTYSILTERTAEAGHRKGRKLCQGSPAGLGVVLDSLHQFLFSSGLDLLSCPLDIALGRYILKSDSAGLAPPTWQVGSIDEKFVAKERRLVGKEHLKGSGDVAKWRAITPPVHIGTDNRFLQVTDSIEDEIEPGLH